MTAAPGIRRGEIFLVPIKALARLVRGKFRAMLQRKGPGSSSIETRCGTRRGSSTHRLGHRGTGGARLSGPLRLSRRSHQRPHRRPRRPNRQHPIQGTQDRSRPEPAASAETSSCADFPPARPAARLPQGALFGLWHPAQRRNAAWVRQMLQLQAPPKLDPPMDPVAPPREPPSADATPLPEPLICPHCRQGRLIFIRTLTSRPAMAP